MKNSAERTTLIEWENDLEHFLGIGIDASNKGKYDISEIRYLYLNEDEKLMGLLKQIEDLVNELSEK